MPSCGLPYPKNTSTCCSTWPAWGQGGEDSSSILVLLRARSLRTLEEEEDQAQAQAEVAVAPVAHFLSRRPKVLVEAVPGSRRRRRHQGAAPEMPLVE